MKDKITKKQDLKKDEVYIVSQAVLGGWFCVDIRIPEDEILDKLWDMIKENQSRGLLIEIPTDNKTFFKDRLFGGFACELEPNRRHIYFALSWYTFLGGGQVPLSDKDRKTVWNNLFDHKENWDTFTGDGPFIGNLPDDINERPLNE